MRDRPRSMPLPTDGLDEDEESALKFFYTEPALADSDQVSLIAGR